MANITITVQSLLNTAVYDSYTIDNGQTITQLKTAINSARGFDSTWYDIVQGEEILSGAATLASLGIITGAALRTHNKISRLATRELRQKAKLDLASLDRAASGNPRSEYDITQLPTQYSGDTIIDNPNEDIFTGRPWVAPSAYPAGTVPFLQMNGGSNDMGDLSDSTATYQSNGFTINSGLTLGSAVIFRNLSALNDNWFDTQANNSGYVWTATWSAGSTYTSTPVCMYYEGFGPETVFFFILDPADTNYETPVDVATFVFPVTFTPGSTPTTFGSP